MTPTIELLKAHRSIRKFEDRPIATDLLHGIANPVATFWSASMMLDHIGETVAAARLMEAIEVITANPDFHTPDLGGTATTDQVTAAIIDVIRARNN